MHPNNSDQFSLPTHSRVRWAISNRTLVNLFSVTIIIAITLLFPPKADADGGSATWLLNPSNGDWIPGPSNTNWTTSGSNKFPGVTSGSTNQDTATFLTSNFLSLTINSTTLNVKSINFGSSTVTPSSFTIGTTGGNSLLLSSGGEIAILGLPSGASGITETVNAPLVLEPLTASTAGTYGFRNSATTSTTVVLNINGAVTGGTTSAGITLDLNGTNAGANTVSGIISNGGAAAGLAVTKSNGGTWILSGANTYTGGTTVSAGLLKLSGSGTLGSTSGMLTVNGGTLDLNGTNQTIGALNGSGGTVLNNATATARTLTVGNGGGSGSYSGVIANNTSGTGTLALTKTGAGTQTLTGNNTYTGATTINASGGTFEINNSNSPSSGRISGTSSVTVNSGGTLLLSGSNSFTDRINNSATITLNGGTFNTGGLSERGGTTAAPTAGVGALTLTATSTINFGLGNTSVIEFAGLGAHTAGAILQITNWNGIAGTGGGTERLLFAGTASDFTSLYTQSDVLFNGASGYAVDQFGSFYEVTAIPEASTWIGGALALGAISFMQRRRFTRKTVLASVA